MADPAIRIQGLTKTFTLHTQGGVRLPVLDRVDLAVEPGECVVVTGPSGAGKSSLLKCIYGGYLADSGAIEIRHRDTTVDIVTALPRDILRLRRSVVGYVTQFLRAVPRVAAVEVVADPLRPLGIDRDIAERKACGLLARLNIPERLWPLAPATFSGGEQQRINIARGFAVDYPILLLDEPTASLDARNRANVVDLIREAKAAGTAIVGVFHDQEVRDAVADRQFELTQAQAAS